MHSRDPNKPWDKFWQEIECILKGTSAHCPKTIHDFRGFVFTQNANFSWAKFTQDANFIEATFNQYANFFGATFTQYADFSGATFIQDANFSWATFNQDANFSGATFTQNANFSWATFNRNANFSGARFTKVANFFRATFTQNANFSEARFTQDANFIEATFTQNANFSRARFTQDAYFGGAGFTQDANFIEATFNRNANFIVARFTRNANFSVARFNQDAHFSGATFTQNANFSRARFTQNAYFSLARFNRNADFSEANVAGVLDFRLVTIGNEGTVLLHQVNKETEVEVPDPKADASKPGEKLNGLRLRLLGTLADRIRFEDVRWDQRPGGGLILQDERDHPNLGATHELVADAYRRLVNNFERARQYEWAEEAVYGEMEMRRRNPERFPLVRWSQAEGDGLLPRFRRCIGQYARKFYGLDKKEHSPNQAEQGPWWQRWARWLGEHVSFTYLYLLLSRYGTSYRRAIVALVALLFVFAALFAWAGVRPREADAATVISWSRAWQQPERWSQMKRAFWAGLMTTLETATLQREPAYRPANHFGRLVAVCVMVAIPGQLALLLLALRRRFRR